MESLERRALVMLVVVALLVARASGLYPGPTWLTAIYFFGLACLTASSAMWVGFPSVKPANAFTFSATA